MKYDIKQFCLVPPPYGGVTMFVKRLSKQLLQDGFSVGGYYTKECVDPDIIESRLYTQIDCKYSSNIFLRALNRFIYDCKRLKEAASYRLVHYHGLENLTLILLMKVLLQKEIVITVHSSMIEGFYKGTSLLNRYAMGKLAKEVQWVAVSEQARECMLNLPIQFCLPIPIIPAYVPECKANLTPLSAKMSEYIKNHNKIVSFYGRSFMFYQGTDIYGFTSALDMYATLHELDSTVGLVFCLSEDKDIEKISELRSYAQSLNIDDKVFWQIGAIDNIQSLWMKTDVYIRLTFTDGDSVAVREVLDCGAYVVASDVCSRPDSVITYEWNNKESLLSKVLYALNLPRRKTSSNYTYYEMMKAMYKNILKKHDNG
ncbi:putative uncharacterized protein [Bacteroides sp. CAG:927]|nr:putative uncharacterized protein [Bacteroides sp. CAG:927]